MPEPPPLVRVYRADLLESVHRGAYAWASASGVTTRRGDTRSHVYYRSTAKPLQALVGVTSGAADRYGLDAAELALAAGSHSTCPEHVATARSILRKADIPESALRCGGHHALDPKERQRQKAAGHTPRPIESNCSGKHALMLATARHLGASLEEYVSAEHPVQREIRRHVSVLAGIPEPEVKVGVDGCGVPTFAVPLDAMAVSLARFAAPAAAGLSADLVDACDRVRNAMLAHPEMVGGPKRFDTDLMIEARTPLVAKAGAEGVHGVAALDPARGLAVAAEDGSDRGYRLVVVTLLEQAGLLGAAEADAIRRRHCDPVIRTLTGEPVGSMEVVLDPE